MVRYVWWSEHPRLCASGVLTTVSAHFKGLSERPIEIRLRFNFAAKIARGGLSKNMSHYRPLTACPECSRKTHYFTDGDEAHAWFDTISPNKWRTHNCMGLTQTKCSDDWQNSPAATLAKKRGEQQKESERLAEEKHRKRKAILWEQKSQLQSIQKLSGVKTNARCPSCKTDIYSFRNVSGDKKLYNTLNPDWQLHECLGLEDDAEIAKPNQSVVHLRNPLVLNTRRKLKLARREGPVEVIQNSDVAEPEKQYILCRLIKATTYQNGYRLGVVPMALPKVHIVLFSDVNADDIVGVKFIYLNDTNAIFLSQNSLEPVQISVDYVNVSKNGY